MLKLDKSQHTFVQTTDSFIKLFSLVNGLLPAFFLTDLIDFFYCCIFRIFPFYWCSTWILGPLLFFLSSIIFLSLLHIHACGTLMTSKYGAIQTKDQEIPRDVLGIIVASDS